MINEDNIQKYLEIQKNLKNNRELLDAIPKVLDVAEVEDGLVKVRIQGLELHLPRTLFEKEIEDYKNKVTTNIADLENQLQLL